MILRFYHKNRWVFLHVCVLSKPHQNTTCKRNLIISISIYHNINIKIVNCIRKNQTNNIDNYRHTILKHISCCIHMKRDLYSNSNWERFPPMRDAVSFSHFGQYNNCRYFVVSTTLMRINVFQFFLIIKRERCTNINLYTGHTCPVLKQKSCLHPVATGGPFGQQWGYYIACPLCWMVIL